MTDNRRGAEVVRAEYHAMLDQAHVNGWQPNCFARPGDFDNDGDLVTAAQAKALCAGCPMLKLCLEYASVTKPASTVMGGKSWNKRAIVEADALEALETVDLGELRVIENKTLALSDSLV